MYSLASEVVIRDGKQKKIKDYEVWFHIPGVGLCESIEELHSLCNESNIPIISATAVPVAVCEEGVYEVLH